MLTDQAKEMFGASGDDDLVSFLIHQSNRIADGITPCSRVGADEDGIIFILFDLMDHKNFRIFDHVSFAIEIIIIEWNKFKKDVIVQRKLHATGFLAALVSEKAFAGKISFDVSQWFA